MPAPAKILPLRQDRTLTEARRRIAAIAELPDQFAPPLPPAHERLAQGFAAALLLEFPDLDSGLGFLFRDLRQEGLARSDPYGAVSGPVLRRAWGLARYEWNLQLEEALR